MGADDENAEQKINGGFKISRYDGPDRILVNSVL